MPVTTEKAAVITVELETGKVFVEGINGAKAESMSTQELEATWGQKGFGYDMVACTLHSHSSPGCVRVIAGRLMKVC